MTNSSSDWRPYYAGLGIYAVCIAVAALPILPSALDGLAALEVLTAATLASVFVAVYRGSILARRFKDSGGVFIQALLGIAVCGGIYSLVSPAPRPEVLFTVFLLWTAVGLMYLTPLRVAALFAVFAVIFANSFASALFVAAGTEGHAEAAYMLVLSVLMAGFMCWRAWDYTRVHEEKVLLKEENDRQAGEIEEAKNRIHALTVQDMDTIALKYPFFRQELQRCKERADRSAETFTIGLVSIDHFAELSQRHGDMAMKQLTREVVHRIAGIVGKVGLESGHRHPVGKVGDGLFGIVLDRTNIKGAHACVERLHAAVAHHMIRTLAGPVDVTITVGLAEYFLGESVDELLEIVGKSLEKARLHEVAEIQAPAARPQPKGRPIQAATGSHDMRILHEKEYNSPVH